MRRDSFWFPFEPNRWLANEKLALVSLAAKGLWIHLLCLMYKANAGGKLTINGNAPTPEQISRMVGQDAKPLLQELEVAGVYEIKDGAIYHGGVATGLAKMEERAAGYAKRMNHRYTIDAPSMNHLCTKDDSSIVYNNSNSNSNNNSNTNKKERERTLVRPTRTDWLAYANEIKWNQLDAESAFDHYESNGWKVGGRAPVKDWKACARNCQRRNQTINQKGTQPMKPAVRSQCESLPTYKVMGFKTREAWVEAGCP